MADLKLDPITRDLIIGSEPQWTTGIGTVLQRIYLRLTATKGEWFVNLKYGLDPILGTKDRRAASAAIRKTIVETQGVERLISFSVNFDGVTREMRVRFRVQAEGEYASGKLDIGVDNSPVGVPVVAPPVEDPNVAPVAGFTVEVLGLEATVTSTATDADGTIAITSYDWGDSSSSAGPTHTYAAGGEYTITQTVTDDDGATDTATQNVTANAAPTAGFTVVVAGLTATVTDTSTDSDGTIVSRSMDWGDGGAVETLAGAGPWEHTYASAGTYNATLTVEDDGGLTDDVTAAISTQTLIDIANAASPLQLFSDACGMDFLMDRLWIGSQLVGVTELSGSGLDMANTGVDQGQMDARLGPGNTCLFNATSDLMETIDDPLLDIGTGAMAMFSVHAFDVDGATEYYASKYNGSLGWAMNRTATAGTRGFVRTASGIFAATVNGPHATTDAQIDLLRRLVSGTATVKLDTIEGAASVFETTVGDADNNAPQRVGYPGFTFSGSWGLQALKKGPGAELVTATHHANLKAWLGF